MAFVIRSERFKQNEEDEFLGPGTYDLIKEPSPKIINTDIEVPFFSNSPRNPQYINKDNLLSPAPGYYEKDNKAFFHENIKLKREHSADLKKFLAYDSFNLNSLNKYNYSGNNPGPGSYNIPNSFGIIPKYLLNRKGSMNNINRVNSAFIDRRVVSIPNKDLEYGYEIDHNGEIIHSKNPFNLSPKNNKKIHSKSGKYRGNLITSAKKNYSKRIEAYSDNEDYNNSSIENSILKNKNSNSQSKIFNPKSHLYKAQKKRNKINEDDLLNSDLSLPEKIEIILNSPDFQNSPGPGYYLSIDYEPENNNYMKRKNVQSFGNLAERFPEKKQSKKDINYSFNENNTDDDQNLKENKEKLFDRKKIDKLGIARDKKHEKEFIKRKKENFYDYVGPGRYDVNNNNYLQKSWNKNYAQFGSFAKRFDYKIKDEIPGPGNYEIRNPIQVEKKNLYFKKPQNIFHSNSESNEFSPIAPMFKNKKKKERRDILINSVEYMFKNNKNKYKIRPFNPLNLERERIIKEKYLERKNKEKEKQSYIGPGAYKIEYSDFERNKGLKFSKVPRLESPNINDNNVGPGDYYNDHYEDWVKPTYNVLFV